MTRALIATLVLTLSLGAVAADLVELPKPQTDGGKPLMQALKLRQSQRSFDTKPLSDQVLSNLLWAAFGVNRENGKRTAPSAVNWQEIDIYVARADGLWLYHAAENALEKIKGEDIRADVGLQKYTQAAPVDLIYVSDHAKMKRAKDEQKLFYSATDTGFISQNVYLFAASEGLATVVIGMVDKPKLHKRMRLRADQHITLAQPVAYPK